MSDDRFATDEQLHRIERGVLRRLDRRAAARRALGRGAVAVVVLGLLGGGIALLHPAIATSTALSGGSSSGEGSASEADRTVRCHVSSAADSRFVVATLGSFSPSAVARTCSLALASPSPSATAGTASREVLCRDDGRLHAFPADAHPDTLCSRNGMRGA